MSELKKRRQPNVELAEARRQVIENGRAAAWGIEELAVSHGVSPGHVRNAIASGELRASKLGRRVVITDENRKAWLSKHMIEREAA